MKTGSMVLLLAAGGAAAFLLWLAFGRSGDMNGGGGGAGGDSPLPYVPPTVLPDPQAFALPAYVYSGSRFAGSTFAGSSPTTLQPRYSVTRTDRSVRFA